MLVALAILATLAAVGLALRPAPVQALAFTVTKTADTNDGSCDTADCSLREAIIVANDSAGADTITVPSGTYTLTLTGTGKRTRRRAIWASRTTSRSRGSARGRS